MVERTKPRLCIDGGPHKAIGKDKLPCELDAITEVLADIKPDMYMVKIDDSNGFMHVNLSTWAKPDHGFKFGSIIYRAIGLPFGLSVSPPKFQMLNKVAINALNRRQHLAYLYLDDRLILSTGKPPPNHTNKATFGLLCLLTAFGGFLSLSKCQLIPTQKMDFLGFLLDTRKQTVEIPRAKYDATMTIIKNWLSSSTYFDIHQLEKIRGKLNSWLIVIPMLRLFIREQNEVIRKAYETDNFYMQKSGIGFHNEYIAKHLYGNRHTRKLEHKMQLQN